MNQFYTPGALKQIHRLKHIPPGNFISIDEKYYNTVPEYITSNESYCNQRALEPHGVFFTIKQHHLSIQHQV